jgi:uncharacterized protein (TIGR02246 family)
MRRRPPVRLVVPVVLLLAAGACRVSVDRPRPAATPEQQVAAIQARSDAFEAAADARDAAALAALYAPDAVVMDPNQPTHRGRDAIRAHYASFIGNPELTIASRATEIVVARAGDMAYEIGTTTARIRAGEQTREIQGRYLAVWTKVNGEWLIAREMSNY